MDFKKVQHPVEEHRFALTEHAIEEFERKNISSGQLIRTICNGRLIKKERDEITQGKLTKYTVEDQNLRITMKDNLPPIIISIRVIK